MGNATVKQDKPDQKKQAAEHRVRGEDYEKLNSPIDAIGCYIDSLYLDNEHDLLLHLCELLASLEPHHPLFDDSMKRLWGIRASRVFPNHWAVQKLLSIMYCIGGGPLATPLQPRAPERASPEDNAPSTNLEDLSIAESSEFAWLWADHDGNPGQQVGAGHHGNPSQQQEPAVQGLEDTDATEPKVVEDAVAESLGATAVTSAAVSSATPAVSTAATSAMTAAAIPADTVTPASSGPPSVSLNESLSLSLDPQTGTLPGSLQYLSPSLD